MFIGLKFVPLRQVILREAREFRVDVEGLSERVEVGAILGRVVACQLLKK